MSLVAPVAACGAVLPLLFDLLQGRSLPVVATGGVGCALLGVAVISGAPGDHGRLPARRALGLAALAALLFGCGFILVGETAATSGGWPLGIVLGARLGTLAMLAPPLVATRAGRVAPRLLFGIAAIGVVDTTAQILFATGAAHGNLTVVTTLASLYPIATVLLGHILLRERLSQLQYVGVLLALVGVGGISLGRP
jgi:drug/metabolite transporter (DMT)-like permease